MTERDIRIRSKADDPVASYWRNRPSSGISVRFLQIPSVPTLCTVAGRRYSVNAGLTRPQPDGSLMKSWVLVLNRPSSLPTLA